VTPHQFFAEVVQHNVEKSLKEPGDLRLACNAIMSLDALMGITFWHLHGHGDSRATRHRDNDSAFKGDLAQSSKEIRALRDAAFSLKHGRLTSGSRVMNSASQVTEGPNVLGYFQIGDQLGGGLVFLDLVDCKTPARDVIGGAYDFLKSFVEGLPK
jgi:hypothetical protein